MWRFIALGLVVIAVLAVGFSLIDMSGGDVSATALLTMPEIDTAAYAQAIEPWAWSFPRDHGAHPEFQTEWWYYTGNLKTEDGRHFGYQFTIFRRAITPHNTDSGSEWRGSQFYMAHFTLSDIDGGRFYHEERFSRGGAGLAGALPDNTDPDGRYRVWLEDWEVRARSDDASQQIITAAGDGFAIEVGLEQVKPPALQGQDGLSPKSDEPGNASYYYSLSRLVTEGALTIDGHSFAVSGNTWMDHEFSTSALGDDALGWDWFGLIFDDDHELMIGQIRLVDGGREPVFGGLMIYPDGSTRYLESGDFVIEATATWESPHTGALYPAGWQVTIDAGALDRAGDLRFAVEPLLSDQELHTGDIAYWEGAVRISGDMTGYGYAELTGYVDAMTGRF
jgi:predicted secreted hydrolase